MIPDRLAGALHGESKHHPNTCAAFRPRISALSVSEIGSRVTCAVSAPMNGSSVPNRICETPTAPKRGEACETLFVHGEDRRFNARKQARNK